MVANPFGEDMRGKQGWDFRWFGVWGANGCMRLLESAGGVGRRRRPI